MFFLMQDGRCSESLWNSYSSNAVWVALIQGYRAALTVLLFKCAMSVVENFRAELFRANFPVQRCDHQELRVGCSHALAVCQELPGCDALIESCNRLRAACDTHEVSPSDTAALWQEFLALKLQLRERCRAAARYGQDWQSPMLSESGAMNTESDPEYCRQTGADYKRYLHKVGATYEQDFLNAGSRVVRNNYRALLCSSGMSAIQISLLSLHRMRPGPIVADKGLYHETKFLLGLFCSEVTFVDSADIAATEAVLQEVQPTLILLEPVRNSAALAALPSETVERLMETVALLPSKPFLWFDDSVSLSFPHLIELAVQHQLQSRVVIAMSLLKLYQHGMDAASAGMVLAPEELLDGPLGMRTLRTHTGANVSDLVAAVLPKPDIAAAQERLAIITRNVGLVARILEKECSSLFEVVAPGTAAAVPLPPSGYLPYFNLIPRNGSIDRCRVVVEEAIRNARASQIMLHAGTSFGFDVTRLYVIDSRVAGHVPFFRISPGLESVRMAVTLGELLSRACLQSEV